MSYNQSSLLTRPISHTMFLNDTIVLYNNAILLHTDYMMHKVPLYNEQILSRSNWDVFWMRWLLQNHLIIFVINFGMTNASPLRNNALSANCLTSERYLSLNWWRNNRLCIIFLEHNYVILSTNVLYGTQTCLLHCWHVVKTSFANLFHSVYWFVLRMPHCNKRNGSTFTVKYLNKTFKMGDKL